MEDLPLLDKSAVEALLRARFPEGFVPLSRLPDPFALHDMDRAVGRIARAIREKERIVVVGDYDVDGVVSSALMEEFFERVGARAEIFIPNRFEDGYGLSAELVARLEADVIVTVDNGINAVEAAALCRRRGIDLVVTDHHTPGPELPDAYAVVNPKKRACRFPYPEICGAQVAWFLIGGLKKELGLTLPMASFLDLLALAIVADVMPLKGINRTLVQKGLERLSTSSRPAFVVARERLGKRRFTAEDVGFAIAPRLNSAGRMGDAGRALRFLRAQSVAEASVLWDELEALNIKRRQTENEIEAFALQNVSPDDPIIVAAGEAWHEGVVGIVASRLAGKFGKPAVVLSVEGGRAKGSGRSVGQVDLYGLLKEASEHLEGFGGHKMAAGLSLEASRIDAFSRAIRKAAGRLDASLFVPESPVLGRLPAEAIDWELMEILQRYEPYGEGNPKPEFLIEKIKIFDAFLIGREKRHLKLTVGVKNRRFPALFFGCQTLYEPGTDARIQGSLQVNEFQGRREIQILVNQIMVIK